MSHALRFLPEVVDDAVAEADWYDDKVCGLGDDLLAIFYEAADHLAAEPERYPTVHGPARRCLLDRFPYAVYFVLTDQ